MIPVTVSLVRFAVVSRDPTCRPNRRAVAAVTAMFSRLPAAGPGYPPATSRALLLSTSR